MMRSLSIFCIVVVLSSSSVSAQGFGQRVLQSVGLAAGKNEKLNDNVLKAFRTVAAKPAKSTVRILADGKAVALGVVIDDKGFVLTKASQLKGKKKVEIRLSGGKRHVATLVGIHRPTDLALIKLKSPKKAKLKSISWAKDDAEVGSWLVTTGLSSMPICIGVTSVKPRKIAPRRGLLGIGLREAEDDEEGPAIRQVLPNSAAAKAKFQVGDVITNVNGRDVKLVQDLINAIRSYRPGHRVHLKIVRNGKKREQSVVLGDFEQISSPNHFQNGLGGPRSRRRGGFVSALQHDSFLKPVDCGGPLVNLDGKAVGINIARASRIASYAIPVSTILPLIPQLKAGKFPADETEAEKRSQLASQLEKMDARRGRWRARRAAQAAYIKKREGQLKAAEKSKKKKDITKAKSNLAEAKKNLQVMDKQLKKIDKQISDLKKKL